jgi:hypothetical protein
VVLQVVGDGLLMSNPKRIQRAIQESACNALLLKVFSHLWIKIEDVVLLSDCSHILLVSLLSHPAFYLQQLSFTFKFCSAKTRLH